MPVSFLATCRVFYVFFPFGTHLLRIVRVDMYFQVSAGMLAQIPNPHKPQVTAKPATQPFSLSRNAVVIA